MSADFIIGVVCNIVIGLALIAMFRICANSVYTSGFLDGYKRGALRKMAEEAAKAAKESGAAE